MAPKTKSVRVKAGTSQPASKTVKLTASQRSEINQPLVEAVLAEMDEDSVRWIRTIISMRGSARAKSPAKRKRRSR